MKKRHIFFSASESNVAPCPFLNKVKNVVKPTTDSDTIEIKSSDEVKSESEIIILNKLMWHTYLNAIQGKPAFPYETFFHEQIIKKKKEHSYRIFKKVNRLAGPGQFPRALEYTWGEKPITVWCSNDYLGMSCHPEVKNAVR